MIYKMTFKGNLAIFKVVLIYLLGFIVITLTILSQVADNPTFIVKVSTALFMIFSVPAIYTHLSYYLHNKGWIIKQNSDHFEVFTGNDQTNPIKLSKNTISVMEIYMSASAVDYNTSNGLPTEEYNYARIISND